MVAAIWSHHTCAAPQSQFKEASFSIVWYLIGSIFHSSQILCAQRKQLRCANKLNTKLDLLCTVLGLNHLHHQLQQSFTRSHNWCSTTNKSFPKCSLSTGPSHKYPFNRTRRATVRRNIACSASLSYSYCQRCHFQCHYDSGHFSGRVQNTSQHQHTNVRILMLPDLR